MMSYPEFFSVLAIPEQVGKGFSKFPAVRTGFCLFKAGFKEEVVCCSSSLKEHELKHSSLCFCCTQKREGACILPVHVHISYYIFLRQPFSLAFKRSGGLFSIIDL